MKYRLLLLSAVCLFLFGSCRINIRKGSGSQATETRAVLPFNKIEISTTLTADITVKQGVAPSLQLSGYANLIKDIKTEVDGGTLRVFINEGWMFNTDKDIKAVITVPSLTALTLDGAPVAMVHGNITGNDFALDISGAGSATFDQLNVSKFSTDISGAGSVTVNGGSVTHAEYDISGSGKIKAFPLQTMETAATISGAGTGEVNAQQKLSADISGAGNIRYKGHPVLSSDVSGVGAVTDAN